MRQVEDAELRDAVVKPSPVRAAAWCRVTTARPTVEIRPAADSYLWSIDAVRVGQTSLSLAAMPAPVLLVDGEGRPVVPDGAWTAPLRLPQKNGRHGRLPGAAASSVCGDPAPIAAGKSAVGMRGVRMTVVKVEREDRTVHVTVPTDCADERSAGRRSAGARAVASGPGSSSRASPLAALLDGLELRDAQGRPLPRMSLDRLDDPGPGVLCRAAFTEVPGDGKGLQLVLAAWMIVRIEANLRLPPAQ